jgi:hypothetical protein
MTKAMLHVAACVLAGAAVVTQAQAPEQPLPAGGAVLPPTGRKRRDKDRQHGSARDDTSVRAPDGNLSGLADAYPPFLGAGRGGGILLLQVAPVLR